jgi:hypothetical protein
MKPIQGSACAGQILVVKKHLKRPKIIGCNECWTKYEMLLFPVKCVSSVLVSAHTKMDEDQR